jgi:S-adenosylmethionine:tRNA ribosyltransferase-isomerase
MNQTKVLPARITLHKENDGKVKVVFLVNEQNNSRNLPADSYSIRGYVDRKVKVGEKLYFNSVHWSRPMDQEGSIFTFEVNFPYREFVGLLNKNGSMPIPLYIKDTPLDEDRLRKRYQTIFARQAPVGTWLGGSAAAPTASLHFSKRLFNKLDHDGIKRYFLTNSTFLVFKQKN